MTPLPPEHVAAGMRRLIASEVASNFGSMLSRLAIPWIAALFLDATPLQMAWLVIADVAAGALGTLLVGGLVDRHSRRRVMVIADVVRGSAMTAVIVLYASGVLDFWMLVVQSAVNGIAAMAFSVARSAWLADNVPEAQLTTRNAQVSAASSTSESVAFAGGGWLFQIFGPMVSLVTDAVSYLVSAWFIRALHERLPETASAENREKSFLADAAPGFGLVRQSSVLRSLLLGDVLMSLGHSITGTSYMIYVTRDLAIDTGVQGLIFATGALGSLAGAAMAPALGRRLGAGRSLAFGLFAAGAGAVCIPLAPSAAWIGVILLVLHQVIGDSGAVIAMIQGRTLRQLHAPAGARGRVDAALRSVSQVVTLLGALGGGWLATITGTREALWLSAFCLLLAAPILWVRLKSVQ